MTISNRKTILAAASGLVLCAAVAGCSGGTAPRADVSAGKAQLALKKGQTQSAIGHAEAAVKADPRDAAYRATLGSAYMAAGRFQSAMTAFEDARALGDTHPRTALGLALAAIGSGRGDAALATLRADGAGIAPDDLGLALALAGDVKGGIALMEDTIRGGVNSARLRQNLGYAYALDGNWRAAKMMAAQDTDPAEINDRLAQWAQSVTQRDGRRQVATLLSVPLVDDPGMPLEYALTNNPSLQQMAEDAAAASAPAARELPPVDARFAPPPAMPQAPQARQAIRFATRSDPATAPTTAPGPVTERTVPSPALSPAANPTQADIGTAPTPAPRVDSTVTQLASAAMRYISIPMIQQFPDGLRGFASASPARQAAAAPARLARDPAPTPEASAAATDAGENLVQLGSYLSEENARRSWDTFTRRYPQLRDHRMVITQARVRGQRYYRVNAGGLAQSELASLCGSIRAQGHGCIRWTLNDPLPGTVESSIRMASR